MFYKYNVLYIRIMFCHYTTRWRPIQKYGTKLHFMAELSQLATKLSMPPVNEPRGAANQKRYIECMQSKIEVPKDFRNSKSENMTSSGELVST